MIISYEFQDPSSKFHVPRYKLQIGSKKEKLKKENLKKKNILENNEEKLMSIVVVWTLCVCECC